MKKEKDNWGDAWQWSFFLHSDNLGRKAGLAKRRGAQKQKSENVR